MYTSQPSLQIRRFNNNAFYYISTKTHVFLHENIGFHGEIRKKCYLITVPELITAHTPISAWPSISSHQITVMYFYLLLYNGICCWYSFELPRQVDAIPMSTNNTAFIELAKLFKGVHVSITFAFIKKIRKQYHISIIRKSHHEVHNWPFSKVCPCFVDIFHSENTAIQIYWKFYNQTRKCFRLKILIFFIFLLKT